jgi:hypothetical protein
MPFLHTQEEVEAHRLVNLFMKGRTDQFYIEADFNSDKLSSSHRKGVGDDNASIGSSVLNDGEHVHVGQRYLDEAEIVHEILVKEALRDRLRTLGSNEKLTEDEFRWIDMDKILSPYVYDDVEIDPPKKPSEIDVLKELNISVVHSRAVDKVSHHKNGLRDSPTAARHSKVNTQKKTFAHPERDGDIFDDLRDRYEAGEQLFDYSWKCPYSREQLLAIRAKTLEEIDNEEELGVWKLMDKYYVDENESLVGQHRLRAYHDMTKKISRHLARLDKAERMEKIAVKKWKEELMKEGLNMDDMSAQERNMRLKQMKSQPSNSTLGDEDDSLSDSSAASSPKKGPMSPFKKQKSGLSRQNSTISRQNSGLSIEEGGEGENEDDLDDDVMEPEDDEFIRVWGSWEQIHPASAGATSQTALFYVSSFSCTRDHPASYAIHPPKDPDNIDAVTGLPSKGTPRDGDAKRGSISQAALQSLGMRSLLSVPQTYEKDIYENAPNSKWYIAENMKKLGETDPLKLKKKIVLLAVDKPMTLLEVKNNVLQARQSRSHRFTVPNTEDCRTLDITVSVLYQGSFGTMGYKLGRLAAGLFRLPDDKDHNHSHGSSDNQPQVPRAVGYSPYHLQCPNLPEHMGKIVIIHRPQRKPIPPVSFQIVVGCASNTKYSIEVTAHIARAALPMIDAAIVSTKEKQGRLPNVFKELESLHESMRLAERKLLVCNKMIAEAETESERCQRVMREVSERLRIDDEEMIMFESERRELKRELNISEVEFTQWAALYESRCVERDDIKEGMALMHEFRRQREDEKIRLKKELHEGRRDLPACIAVLRSFVEATNVAAALNTTVQSAFTNYSSASADIAAPTVSTPAEDVRRTLKREGYKALSLEEQQWLMLDQALSPTKYEWMKEKQDKENEERKSMGKAARSLKYSPAVEAFRMSKHDIVRILDAPFTQLTRREVIVRKLMTKYHDDAEGMKKAFMASSYGFDAFLAERTRAKHPRGYNKEEKEWSSMDRILHPEVWKRYATHDDALGFTDKDSKAAIVGGSLRAAGKFEKVSQLKSRGDRSDQAKKQLVGQVGKLLGMEQEVAEGAELVGGDIEALVKNTHDLMTKTTNPLKPWICKWSREEILRVWKTPLHHLKTEEERHATKLLLKYNGSYSAYMEATNNFNKRLAQSLRPGVHVQWSIAGKVISSDVDLRGRQLVREIDRARLSDNDWLDSDVLHGQKQRFPAKVLQMHLEDELDVLLSEQIKDRERASRKNADTDSSDEDDGKQNNSSSEDDENEEDDGLSGHVNESLMQRIQRRVKRREKRRAKLQQHAGSTEKELLKVKKQVGTKGKTGNALAEAILQNQLGLNGCLACRSNPCKWTPCIDLPSLEARIKELEKELERVKFMKENAVIESTVCLCAQQGGNKIFRRLDLIEELNSELTEIKRYIELNNVDRELHDSFATRKEFLEVKHLHGYAVMMWTNNARFALNQRQRRLVAYTVAKEVVDDILDYMLEGWYFGERESSFQALGYVPSVKPDGMVKAGQDQIRTMGKVAVKMKERSDARRKGLVTDPMARGIGVTKAVPVEEQSQFRLTEQKVAREGNQHEHMLNETESTLRFGLFMLTLMYFRAMTYLSRDKKAFSGADDDVGGNHQGKVMTDERMRMIDEENKSTNRKKKLDAIMARAKVGEQRRIEREARERKEAIQKLQAIVRRQKQETESILHIQRVFRGHLGRKAASRWALKRAELGAMNALLNATAITIQRYYRGYLGREIAIVKRMEMAQFIALMRAQEAAADEDLYWETHPWKNFNRKRREWMDKTFRKAHQTEVLGGSRLTADEEARLKREEGDDGASEYNSESSSSGSGSDDEDGSSAKSSASAESELNSTKLGMESSKSVMNRQMSIGNLESGKSDGEGDEDA